MAKPQHDSSGDWLAAWTQPWFEAEEEARRNMAENAGPDARVIVVLTLAAVLLTAQHYLLTGKQLDALVGGLSYIGLPQLEAWLTSPERSGQDHQLTALVFWSVGTCFLQIAIPAAVVLFAFRQPLDDYGAGPRRLLDGVWIYAAMVLVMAPLVYLFSTTDAFQAKYPFYRLAPGEPLWPRFAIWEVFYVAQFVAVEFFFRGFLLHGLKHRFGGHAIWVMMVPYCMIHFGKPLAETCGAIGAGLALGYMSLKTRSIWPGVALHVAVALGMDTLALWHRGQLG